MVSPMHQSGKTVTPPEASAAQNAARRFIPLVIERPQAHIIPIAGYIKQSEAFAKSKGDPWRPPSTTIFEHTRLLVIRLTLTLHLFVLLHHFLLHLLPFGLLVRG